MKANELMIGDWVQLNGDPLPRQVQELMFDGVTIQCWPHTHDDIFPIPLTGEILEKNGFVSTSDGLYVLYKSANDGFIKVRLSDLLDGEWELYIDNYDKFIDSHTTFSIDRVFLKVHELQHAMRLCGIKKEIEL